MFKKILFLLSPIIANAANITEQAKNLLEKMTLDQKIAQKIMIDFTYWCDKKDNKCKRGLTETNPSVKKILGDSGIGGIVLFSSNIKNMPQTITLTDSMQNTMRDKKQLPLLIAVDQEGGEVVRLPQNQASNFAGNMAIAAAYEGNPKNNYAFQVAHSIGEEIRALGFNVNFAPDVDVNSNPNNPIIGVRSFGDNPKQVALLGREFSEGLQSVSVASVLKHFPGHGDTVIDSHLGLPLVNHNSEQVWHTDLYPFQEIIKTSTPDMVMTAHIQYPALDNQQIYANKKNQNMTVPATLSHTIITDLLRQQLNYQGVVISDALRVMKAISDNFSMTAAVVRCFLAGNDIALMPLTLDNKNQPAQVEHLIQAIHKTVKAGILDSEQLDKSVLRILTLKLKLGLLKPDVLTLDEKIARAKSVLSDPQHKKLEQDLANASVTLVKNDNKILPIAKDKSHQKIYLLMPARELAVMREKIEPFSGSNKITAASLESTAFKQQKLAIDDADIVIAGNASLVPSPAGNKAQQVYQALHYAKQQHKKTIYLSLLSPYDLPLYQNVADVMIAGYSNREPTLLAEARMLFGDLKPQGKLPVKLSLPVTAQPLNRRDN